MNDDELLERAGYARPMTREELRRFLDRKPPPGSWRNRKPEKSAFDQAREADPQMEAGHA